MKLSGVQKEGATTEAVKLELLQCECLSQLNSEEFQVCLMFIFYVSETSVIFLQRKN